MHAGLPLSGHVASVLFSLPDNYCTVHGKHYTTVMVIVINVNEHKTVKH